MDFNFCIFIYFLLPKKLATFVWNEPSGLLQSLGFRYCIIYFHDQPHMRNVILNQLKSHPLNIHAVHSHEAMNKEVLSYLVAPKLNINHPPCVQIP